jgi:hypothetical protein
MIRGDAAPHEASRRAHHPGIHRGCWHLAAAAAATDGQHGDEDEGEHAAAWAASRYGQHEFRA